MAAYKLEITEEEQELVSSVHGVWDDLFMSAKVSLLLLRTLTKWRFCIFKEAPEACVTIILKVDRKIGLRVNLWVA